MATMTITIPDGRVAALLDAFALQYGYQETIEDGDDVIPNPISKVQFAKEQISRFIKSVYISAKIQEFSSQRSIIIATATSDIDEVTTT